jgi:GcrA cell cycle regulator
MSGGISNAVDFSPAEVETLTALWCANDLSTFEIATAMRRSKNSIVGKAHRLGLPAKPSPIKLLTPEAISLRVALGAVDRQPHPPGHSATWGAITRGTLLDGCRYPRDTALLTSHPAARAAAA